MDKHCTTTPIEHRHYKCIEDNQEAKIRDIKDDELKDNPWITTGFIENEQRLNQTAAATTTRTRTKTRRKKKTNKTNRILDLIY